jgi:DNA-binding phage protein
MAKSTNIHEKSLSRMLGPKGNPTTGNLLTIIRVLAEQEKVTFAIKEAKTRKAA